MVIDKYICKILKSQQGAYGVWLAAQPGYGSLEPVFGCLVGCTGPGAGVFGWRPNLAMALLSQFLGVWLAVLNLGPG